MAIKELITLWICQDRNIVVQGEARCYEEALARDVGRQLTTVSIRFQTR